MGPLIPSITLTDPNGNISMIYDDSQPSTAWSGVDGTRFGALTNKGRLVRVWKPAQTNSTNEKYFCHGLSLDTYRRYGYSVFSGPNILKTLEDEYDEIGIGHTPKNAISRVIPGDIISFSNLNTGIIHTVVVINVPVFIESMTEQDIFESLMVWVKDGKKFECVESLLTSRSLFLPVPIMRYWRAR
ncbi:MAG: hypothetical protein KAH18_10665 [Psychromonas sp.]|nr:hypothetical protein [Psychromonas sp.]